MILAKGSARNTCFLDLFSLDYGLLSLKGCIFTIKYICGKEDGCKYFLTITSIMWLSSIEICADHKWVSNWIILVLKFSFLNVSPLHTTVFLL